MKFLTLFSENPGCWTALPDSVGLPTDRPLYLPDFPDGAALIPMAALRNCRLGKCIEARFADRYVDAVAPAIQLLPRGDAEEALIGEAPASSAACFDCAIVSGIFRKYNPASPPECSFLIDDHPLHSAPLDPQRAARAIEILSLCNTLKTGDVILLPQAPPTPVSQGQHLSAHGPNEPDEILLRVRFK